MKLSFNPGAWAFRSPSGGGYEILGPGQARLYGRSLSYSALDCAVPQKPGWVRLSAACQTEGLASPETAVSVLLSFYDSASKPLRRQYVEAMPEQERGLLSFSRYIEAPQFTQHCIVTLSLRWPNGGSATFDAPELIPAEAPSPRKARVAVTHFPYSSLCDCTDRIAPLFDQMRKIKPDLVCLSEGITTRGVSGGKLRASAEPINGKFASLLSSLAAKHQTYVTGNFAEAN